MPTRDAEAYDLFLKGEYEEREAESTYNGSARQRRNLLSAIAGARSEFRACVCATRLQPLKSALVYVNRLTSAQLEEVKSNVERALAIAPDFARGTSGDGHIPLLGPP